MKKTIDYSIIPEKHPKKRFFFNYSIPLLGAPKSKTSWILSTTLVIVILVFGIIFTFNMSNIGLDEVIEEADNDRERLVLKYESSISNGKCSAGTLASIPCVASIYEKNTPEDMKRVNQTLDNFKDKFGFSVCYLMNIDGVTIASSNRNEPETFIGKNYSFRPYFVQAKEGNTVHYMALGVTSNVRGLYFSHPIKMDDERIIGVAVIKMKVEDIEKDFSHLGNSYLVSDHGIIFISSGENSLFKTIGNLNEQTEQDIIDTNQFGPGPFSPYIDEMINDGDRVKINGHNCYASVHKFNEDGWKLIHFRSLDQQRIYMSVGIVMSLAIGITLLGLLFYFNYQKGYQDLLKRNESFTKKVNEQLIEKEQMKNEFISILSHDLGNPMMIIDCNVNLIKNRKISSLTKQQAKSIQNIENSTKKLMDLRRDTLELSKMEMGNLSLSKTINNVSDMCHEVASDFISLVSHKGMRIHVAIDQEIVAECDRRKILKVLENYVSNAVRYSKVGSEIIISAKKSSNELIVTVTDSGRGLENKDLEKVFESFYRAGEKVEGSTGLGLAIVKGIVKAHGGRVWAESEGIGRGSRFNFALPLST